MEDFFWHFGVREGGSDTADNIDAKFFIDNYASLVRESLQNSLDAQADPTQPVRVSYKFGTVDIPSDSKFYDLEKYIQGCLRLHPNQNDRVYKAYTPMLAYIQRAKESGKISFLEVSDSNTIGMDYIDDDEKSASTRFYSFAKSVGNTAKNNETSGGSYGLGKAVFYKNSKIRTIIISTKTENGLVAFEGIASLCTSKVDDKKFEATGYFCEANDEKPTIDESRIPEIFRRKKSGTSIFIIGVDDSPEGQQECYEKIQKAISSHFWLSIMHKKLVVEIGENTIIDDSNIIKKASECFEEGDEDSPIPFIETVCYAEAEEDIPDYYKEEREVDNLGKCVLYIRKDRRKGRDIVLNMRKTEMLIFQQSILKGYGFYGVFVCLGEEGNKILRMAEDPAHKSWNSNYCEGADVQKARAAIQSKNAFIKQTIMDKFGNTNENTASISDLQNYLYLNISEQELEESRKALYGIHSMEEQKEESESKIPDLFPDYQPEEQQKPQDIPVFTVEENDTVSKAEDEDNDTMWGGHEGHGGDSVETIIKPLPQEEYKKDEDGKEKGRLLLPTSMKACAVYNKKVDGVLYHFLRVVPAKDCAELVLDVFAVGDTENASDEIYIDSVMQGNLEGHNRISGLVGKSGERLEIGIKFEDNMSHPVNVIAYEVTQVQ